MLKFLSPIIRSGIFDLSTLSSHLLSMPISRFLARSCSDSTIYSRSYVNLDTGCSKYLIEPKNVHETITWSLHCIAHLYSLLGLAHAIWQSKSRLYRASINSYVDRIPTQVAQSSITQVSCLHNKLLSSPNCVFLILRFFTNLSGFESSPTSLHVHKFTFAISNQYLLLRGPRYCAVSLVSFGAAFYAFIVIPI